MHNFVLAFSVVCPLLLMMSLGYFLRRVGLFQEDFLRQLNKVCFQVFLPLILFMNVYDSDFEAAFQPKLIVISTLLLVSLFAVLMVVVPRFEREDRRRGVLVQGIFRSNFILFGLPVVSTLFGPAEASTAAVLIAFVIPVFNVLAVVALEVFHDGKTDVKRILIGIVTNPLILGAMAALLFVFVGIRLPMVVERTVRDISRIATPLSLIVLGGFFQFSGLQHNRKTLICAVTSRLVLVPLVYLSISIALGIRGAALCTLLAMFASPTAVSSFTMAQHVGADDELAGQIVVLGSVFSMLTIFLWISVLNGFGFLSP